MAYCRLVATQPCSQSGRGGCSHGWTTS